MSFQQVLFTTLLMLPVGGCLVGEASEDQEGDLAGKEVSVLSGTTSACAAYSPVPHLNNGNRNIEFLAFGDTQFALVGETGCNQGPSRYRVDQNGRMIAALNSIESAKWPTGFGFFREGKPFRNIRGVLIAGDITENGAEPLPEFSEQRCREFKSFRDAYGLCGERSLRYPVYEGYGNHDFPFLDHLDTHFHRVVNAIDRRNPFRPDVTHTAKDKRGHYAWVWDDIHFINLNVKPAGIGDDTAFEDIDKGPLRKRRVNPHFALGYLNGYLRSGAVRPGSQFIIMSHYGPSNGSRLPAAQRRELCRVLDHHRATKNVRLVAWIHGHTHRSDHYNFRCPEPYDRVSTPVFNVGSPHYRVAENKSSVHFAAFRLGNTKLEAVDVSSDASGRLEIPGRSSERETNSYNPDGKWGGWAVSLDDHLTPPQ